MIQSLLNRIYKYWCRNTSSVLNCLELHSCFTEWRININFSGFVWNFEVPIGYNNRQENLFLFQNLFHAFFLTRVSGFSSFKISLLMAKCQKSENFLSELQQAFLQAKRSVQEQMVRQINSRDPWPALFVWPWELSVSVKGFVCSAKGGWGGLSIFTCKGPGPVSSDGTRWSWNSSCHSVSMHVQEHGDHWPTSFLLIHNLMSCFFSILISPPISRGWIFSRFFQDLSQVPSLVNIFSSFRDEWSVLSQVRL